MTYIRRARWTARQQNFLNENWDKMSDEKISEILGKTLKSVRRKRERLLLKKASGRGIVRAYGDSKTTNNNGVPTAKSSEPDGTMFSL